MEPVGLADQIEQQQRVLAALAVLQGEAPTPLPLTALVAERDRLIQRLAGAPEAAQRQVVRGELMALLRAIDARYGR